MSSKNLVFVVLLCALVLFVSSTLAAEKAPEDHEVQQPDQIGGRGRGGCRYGCCGRFLFGHCNRCCRTESEASTMSVDGYGVEGHRGGSGWGGGRGGGSGRGGGGSGSHCRYGCCGGHGQYCRCCYNAEEAQAVQGEN